MTELKPVGDRLLVERETAAEVTQAGVYVPTAKEEKLQTVKVIGVGDRVSPADADRFAVGRRLFVPTFSGVPVQMPEYKGRDVVVIKTDEVLGIVE